MAELLNHYKNVWRHFAADEFEIIYSSKNSKDVDEILKFAQVHDYTAISLDEVVGLGRVYRTVVSNHPGVLGVDPKGIPFIANHGINQVRMMYSLGKANWNFSSWNAFYHLVLPWGPYHEQGLGKMRTTCAIQVGYPRFDHFFWGEIDQVRVRAELGLDDKRKTVLWLPTWEKLSSIDAFAGTVGSLKDKFNVLVKVHPLTVQLEPQRLKILSAAGVELVSGTNRDNVELLCVADYVLADYGGSAFGAIYLGKGIILLNVPEASQDQLTGLNSMDIQLRKHFPSIEPHQAGNLAALLEDFETWEGQETARKTVSDIVFAPCPGQASKNAAEAIRRAPILAGKFSGHCVDRWRSTNPGAQSWLWQFRHRLLKSTGQI